MECPVCYETFEGSKVTKMCCGHMVHTKCLREWYLKAESEPTCPMCRGPVLFRGMFKTNWDQMKDEDEESLLTEYIEQVFEEAEEDWLIKEESLTLIMEAQMVYNTAKTIGCPPDEIDYMLWDLYWISPKRATRNGKYVPDFVVKHKAPKNFKGPTNKNKWTKSRF